MERKFRGQALTLFLILSGIFIASLVGCNLIFQKFFVLKPFAFFGQSEWSQFTFEASVGLLAYPVTFLVTDLISELYGMKWANRVVLAGFISALFIYLLVSLAENVEATVWSPISNEIFSKVFGLTGPAVLASMCAYLIAQFIDIRLFHFWKKLTNGKKLWLRNNLSTIPSQFVDTAVVLLLLCLMEKIEWQRFSSLFLNGFLYKIIFALVDTPILYVMVYFARRMFEISENEELKID
ncbi:MAG: queuosine precursor transporter [Bacteroidota bacterium]